MPLLKLLRTTTFRLAVVYLAIFAASAYTLLFFLYFSTSRFMAAQTDETIMAEVVGLEEQYRRRGLPGLRQVVIERSAKSDLSIYLLANGDRSRIAGNLTAWPGATPQGGDWIDFQYERPLTAGGTATRPARARRFVLEGNFLLLVGRDVNLRQQVEERISAALGWAGAMTLAIGVLGGLFMSRNMLTRLDAINRASTDIMRGDLTRRVPISGNEDELDDLAQNLNSMLDQIERLMAGMRDVADNIAHDLRTPLNRLRSRLEVTLMKPASAEEYQTAIEAAIADADGLIRTFNALLLIAETETGAARENMSDVNLEKIVRDVTELYEPVAEGKEIVIDVKADSGVTAYGNAMLISQALANLVDNAIKYSPQKGRIAVRAGFGPRGPELTVVDSGPGIPAADRERVLRRFVRLEASRSAPGAGLGLSLVSAIARLHNAAIALDDANPGLRVTLSFPLPALAVRALAPRAPHVPSEAAPTPPPRK